MCGGGAVGTRCVLFDAHGWGQIGGVPVAGMVYRRFDRGLLAPHIAHTGPGACMLQLYEMTTTHPSLDSPFFLSFFLLSTYLSTHLSTIYHRLDTSVLLTRPCHLFFVSLPGGSIERSGCACGESLFRQRQR